MNSRDMVGGVLYTNCSKMIMNGEHKFTCGNDMKQGMFTRKNRQAEKPRSKGPKRASSIRFGQKKITKQSTCFAFEAFKALLRNPRLRPAFVVFTASGSLRKCRTAPNFPWKEASKMPLPRMWWVMADGCLHSWNQFECCSARQMEDANGGCICLKLRNGGIAM